jgi:lipopolysaccharide/colanic/teichoic acid biosynthesis glycosyltransferase
MVYRRLVKPVADRLLGSLALLALSPILVMLAIAIRQRMGSPILFRQIRIGMNNDQFVFMKFRTMTDETDSNGRLLPDEKRLTRFGRFLRSTSLDEIPQLWNVVKGQMSLIGPRPLLPEYLPLYSPVQQQRHKVKPGITGLAQVKGRNSISWEEKFELDVYYVDHHSLKLDMEIFWLTFASVIKRKGISQHGHATASPFLGSNREASK